MIEYQSNWETFETFDFSTIISSEDEELAKHDIRSIIADGNYFKNSPLYQTQENIFKRQAEHWLKFRMSFVFACFMYLKQEVQIKNIQSWSFMTSDKTTVADRNELWHNHQLEGERTVSGIYYLHMPDDVHDLNTCGTEFAIDGVEGSQKWVGPVKKFNWLIYPGKTWHRPMPPQSNQDRFVIAADMIF